ncbi:hypothetical protein [Cohnella cellulosilytica]|uniref:Uncharacterized protein n=1 Tax=Cohnella cellulosilytica TaxID=986710 RepID=A0ABW2FK27_9BACL
MDQSARKQPLEVDIRRILEQLGIHKEKWPDEFAARIEGRSSKFTT